MSSRTLQYLAMGSLVALTSSACGDSGETKVTHETVVSDGGVVVSVNTVACAEDVDCDNGVYCDGQESCSEGVCTGGSAVECDDGIDCTVDRCDEAAAACSSEARDLDGDGHLDGRCEGADGEPLGTDCDDTDSARFPGNVEICDDEAHDEDCDLSTFGEVDFDMDGFNDATCCNADADTRNCGQDCNDLARGQHPDATEVCDTFDNDCDGEVDETFLVMGYVDADRDSYGAGDPVEYCPGVGGFSDQGGDCDDTNRNAAPDLNELCADGVDNNCNDEVDESGPPSLWYRDLDEDGFGDINGDRRTRCEEQPGYALRAEDCNDLDPLTYLGADERCDGYDNDCDGSADYIVGPGNGEDDDNDGSPDVSCGLARIDCDDRDATVRPGAPELCDGIDNDCNGVIDGLVQELSWYVDGDHDGYGDDNSQPIVSCELLAGRVSRGGDCNDSQPAIHAEQSDGCGQLDNTDDDCDGQVDEDAIAKAFFFDGDQDGVGAGPALLACFQPADFSVTPGDCDDLDGVRYPGADESCAAPDGIDNDCDLLVDCADPDCWVGDACDNQGALTITLPPSYSPVVTRTIDVTITLKDDGGSAVQGATVVLGASAGAWFKTGNPVTDANGEVAATLRLGAKPGDYIFTASVPSVRSQSVTIEALAPAPGTVTTVVNEQRSTAAPRGVEGGLAVETRINVGRDVAITSDGTVYVADEGDKTVYRVTPAGIVERVAGGGLQNPGDLGRALDAHLAYAYGVVVDEDAQRLYIMGATSMRVVDLNSGLIDTVAATEGSAGQYAQTLTQHPNGQLIFHNGYNTSRRIYVTTPGSGTRTEIMPYDCGQPLTIASCSYGCPMTVTPDGAGMYIAGSVCGTQANLTVGVLYGEFTFDGQGGIAGITGIRVVAGDQTGIDALTLVPDARLAGESTALSLIVPALTTDSAGNLFMAGAATGDMLARVDRVTGEFSYVGGMGNAPNEGDFYPVADATFGRSYGMDFDDDGNLLFADSTQGVRKVWGLDQGAVGEVTLTVDGGEGQMVYINQGISPVRILAESSYGTIAGHSVVFEMDPATGYPWPGVDLTDSLGIAMSAGRVGLVPGTYDVMASFFDTRGNEVESIAVPVIAQDVPVGWVYPLMNPGYSGSGTAAGKPAPLAVPKDVRWGLDFTSDGSVYFSGRYRIYRVTPEGMVEAVAGTGSLSAQCPSGPGNDGLLAVDTQLCAVHHLAVNEDAGLLYFITDGSRIRVVDLQTGVVDHFYDLSGHGVIRTMELDDQGGLLFVDTTNMAVVRLNDDGTLDAGGSYDLVEPGATCSNSAFTLRYCRQGGQTAYDDTACSGPFAADGTLTVAAHFCGSEMGYTSDSGYPPKAVARRELDGSWTRLAGLANGISFSEGVDGKLLSIGDRNGAVAIGPAGDVYFTDAYGYNRIRRIDAQGRVYSVLGAVGGGITGDYGPAVDATGGGSTDTIRVIKFGPDGRLYMTSETNIRVVRTQ